MNGVLAEHQKAAQKQEADALRKTKVLQKLADTDPRDFVSLEIGQRIASALGQKGKGKGKGKGGSIVDYTGIRKQEEDLLGKNEAAYAPFVSEQKNVKSPVQTGAQSQTTKKKKKGGKGGKDTSMQEPKGKGKDKGKTDTDKGKGKGKGKSKSEPKGKGKKAEQGAKGKPKGGKGSKNSGKGNSLPEARGKGYYRW